MTLVEAGKTETAGILNTKLGFNSPLGELLLDLRSLEASLLAEIFSSWLLEF